jgi:hypothetical protein
MKASIVPPIGAARPRTKGLALSAIVAELYDIKWKKLLMV